MFIIMFVDDFQIGYHNTDREEWNQIKGKFMNRFKTKDLGQSKWMLGMSVTRDRMKREIWLNHDVYVKTALGKFNLSDCGTVSIPEEVGPLLNEKYTSVDMNMSGVPYLELVGTLLYAAISIRLDVAHVVHQLTKHTKNPHRVHWEAAKRVLRYLKGTSKFGLYFKGTTSTTMKITAFVDADFANDKSDRKSVTGWIVKLNGDIVNWSSKKQSNVADSTCASELCATESCVKEIMWLQHLLREIGLHVEPQSIVHCDNQASLALSENGVVSERTKHIDIKYHFITEQLNLDVIKLLWIKSEDQQADILTKALGKNQFIKFRDMLLVDV
jgi:hypothetical protein